MVSINNTNIDTTKLYPRVGVATFLVNTQNQILIGNRINSHGHDTWALPGGHLEFMETVENCAQREVLEETGIVINEVKILNITNDFLKKDNKHYITIFTLTKSFHGVPEIKEPDKCRYWKWVNVNDFPKNLFQPLDTFIKMYGTNSLFK
jgi:8-oxo-dGTP diphosphatase